MNTLSNVERMNLSNAKALRRAREQLKVTKVELARKLDVSVKTIDRLEKGEGSLTEDKIKDALNALSIGEKGFLRAKKGRSLFPEKKREKLVIENAHRRSYQKLITKEVQALRALRKMKGLSQDQASSLCGYSRPTIGHIENGRMEIPLERIRHIVLAYGYEMQKFNELMKEEILRLEIIENCQEKLTTLSEEKLKLVHSLLANI